MSGKKAKALRRLQGPVSQPVSSELRKATKSPSKAIAIGMIASYLVNGGSK